MSTKGVSGSSSISRDDMEKTLPKIKKPSERKADDSNAPLNTGAVDIPQVVEKGSLGFGVQSGQKKIDVEA